MHRKPANAILLAVLLTCSGWAFAQTYFPPPEEWAGRGPEDASMDPVRLAEAVAFAIAEESTRPRDQALVAALGFAREPYNELLGPTKVRGDATGLIIRNGYIVAQWGEPSRVDMTHSVTKSFLSTTIGLAYDRGMIRDLNDPVRIYMPGSHFESEHNRKITWDHLLRQTSAWEGTLWDKPDWGDRPVGDDPFAWPDTPHPEPGTVYKYNDVRVNLLALAALHVWREPLPQVLRRHVMDPIDASNTWRWHGYRNSWVVIDGQKMQSVSGGGHWGGGMWISAYDQARFGYLVLHRGVWNGERIFSEEWYELASTPGAAEPGYGFMNWFLNTDRKMYPSAPENTITHRGAGANIVYVDPGNDLVIVARWIDRDSVNGLIARVLAAIQ